MTPASLALRDLAGSRGDRLLFEGLSRDLGPGDALLVAGANGAGKSTLLAIVAGLLPPLSGTATHAGGLALAPADGDALDPGLPLGDALGYWARLDGASRHVAPAMAAMGVDALAAVPVRMLSTGQRRRAVLARTIASGAGVWLLDEPGNGLDADGLARLGHAMAAHRAGGGIVVAASHQPLGLIGAQVLDLTGPPPAGDETGWGEWPETAFPQAKPPTPALPPVGGGSSASPLPFGERVGRGERRLDLTEPLRPEPPLSPTLSPGGRGSLFGLLARDIARHYTAGAALLPILFFLMVATLFPFAVGPDAALLARTGGGALWMAALLAALLPVDRLIEPDRIAGVLDQYAVRGIGGGAVALSKLVAHWLGFAPPLMLAVLPAAALLKLDAATLVRVEAGLLLGTPGLAALGLLTAALTAGLRGAGALAGLVMLPLAVPLLIFGAGALGDGGAGALKLLAATSLLLLAIVPFATAAAVTASRS